MFAVIFIPDFALQSVLRLEPELASIPLALVDPALPKATLVQLTAAARERGVAEGLTPSQAMARCGELLIKPRSVMQEQASTDALLQTAYAFSPRIEATAAGVCTLGLKGLGLETDDAAQRWADQILRALAGLNLHAQIGIACTPALALLAAHAAEYPLGVVSGVSPDVKDAHPASPGDANATGSPSNGSSAIRRAESHGSTAGRMPAATRTSVCIVRDSTRFVSVLPVAALNPSPEIADVLARWGIRTVGQLTALGKMDLSERLGTDAVMLLDQVSLDSIRPLKLVMPREVFEEQMEFEQEIETAEPLLFVLRRFVEQLARRFEVIHLVVAELHLRLGLASGATYERAFNIPAPTGSVETLFRMLQTHLETVRTDAPIVSLRLEAKPCKPETHQFGLFETTLKDPNQFAETMARLMALCGADRVGTPVLESTHRPDAFRMQAPEFDAAAETRRLATCPPSAGALLRRTGGPAVRQPALQGVRLRRFRPAWPAQIEFRDHRPTEFYSGQLKGIFTDVRGPFLSSGDWWDRNPWSREEWDAQAADGVIYRICRSPDGCFVEGVYD